MSTHLNNINTLPPDCMMNIFMHSEESPAILARVCKIWQNALEESYPVVAACYRKDSRILPFMPSTHEINIDTNDIQPKAKRDVQEAYRRIVKEFLKAPHIERNILEQGLKTNPFALGPILSVAEDSNLVESFEEIFIDLADPHLNAARTLDSFPLWPGIDALCSNKDKALCVRHWITTHSPEILNQEDVKFRIHRCITALPLEVLSISPNITMLDLGDNHLNALPDEIATLSKLESLHLNRNKFTFIPETIFKLGSLKFLNFNQNEISHLPTTICQLSKLEFITLYRNKLTSLPEEFFQLTNLKDINIDKNNINPTELRRIADRLQLLPTVHIEEFKEIHKMLPN